MRHRPIDPTAPAHAADEVRAWAACGAMALTGRADGPPLGPPAGFVPRLDAVGATLRARATALGSAPEVDVLALLGERAAIAGLTRHGDVSCGGATRLLPARDGWLAVALARPDDLDLVEAWLGAVPGDDPWATVAGAVQAMGTDALVERGRLLGLPVAALPAGGAPRTDDGPPGQDAATQGPLMAGRPAAGLSSLPVRATLLPGEGAPTQDLRDVLVVDLSALWAGPLCGALLAEAGARVVKVESTARPDGARSGPAAFFDLLNHRKRSVALDLGAPDGVEALRGLLRAADVVIEASRPRALEQLGIDAAALVATAGPRVWVSITGHGRTAPQRDWVAFGDDAAVAGGLVAWDAAGPCFCADAVADPATGLVAAAAALEALATGGRWLLDVALAGVAAHLAGPTLPTTGLEAAPAAPTARQPIGTAPRLGEHTATVLAERAAAR